MLFKRQMQVTLEQLTNRFLNFVVFDVIAGIQGYEEPSHLGLAVGLVSGDAR